MAQEHSGSCNCGAVKFIASGAPRFVANCHCAACRKATGAAFSTYAGFRSEDINWVGAPRAIFESSPGVRRGFCAACGTPMSYENAKWPGETHLFIGCFDSADEFKPTEDVFTGEALAWALTERTR